MKALLGVLMVTVGLWAQTGQVDPEIVVYQGKYGFIRPDGSFAISPKYLFARNFYKGRATVFICGTAVSIDADEKIAPVQDAEGLRARSVVEGDKAKTGFVDRLGNFAIPPAYDEVWDFSDGLAAVSVDDKWGYVDKTGKLVIPMMFDMPGYFANGRAIVVLGDLKALIDKSGNVLRDGFTESSFAPPGKLSAFEMDGKWGFIDLNGKTAVPFRYERAEDFSDGLAAVERHNKWGFINESGAVIIPYKFDKVGQFSRDLAWAKVGTKTGYIRKNGRFAFLLESESGNEFGPSGLASFFAKGYRKFGYVDQHGRVVWGPTSEMPSHPPLFGWSKELVDESCEGFSEPTKSEVEKIELTYR